MELGFLFFEFAGHSLLTFSDLVVTIPELFNRQIRRKNGIFYRIAMQFTKFRSTFRIMPATPNSHYTLSVDTATTNTPTSTTTPTSNFTNIPQSSVILNKSDNTASSLSILATPFQTTSSSAQQAQPSEKVKNLECELTRLREEIARIMAANGSGATNTVQAPVVAGPPPPPPPAPPVYKATSNALKRLKPNGSNSPSAMTPTKQGSMSIGDLLRSGQKVTLKKSDVVRSPGGTPVRDVTNQQHPISTQDFIAIALKKKFSSMKVDDSPEIKRPRSYLKNKSNNDSFFSDSDNDTSFDDQENIPSFI